MPLKWRFQEIPSWFQAFEESMKNAYAEALEESRPQSPAAAARPLFSS